MDKPEPIVLNSCPKGYSQDLDKAISPEETTAKVGKLVEDSGLDIVAGIRRVDTGRLGIPVYLGVCGDDAREIMPTRKQMGKGSSIAQAKASALMEVMERYAFFSFWERKPHFIQATWSKAKKLFGDALIPVEEILISVHDSMPAEQAEELLELVEWQFYPATHLASGKIVWLPLDWFRMLGEFNGSSAGNTQEESILQGLSELVERHVCCIIDRARPELPTIDPNSCHDKKLVDLLKAFRINGVNLVLKDISSGMPLPTVAALAWDPSTFPGSSEIVFTAGTATSPAKAAIRAITEVAQLAGDFCTNSCYEASGLPKFYCQDEYAWLLQGANIALDALPSVENKDMREEILATLKGLEPVQVYCVDTTNPAIGVPCHYCIAPGLEFRERDSNQSMGLFIGRKLAEEQSCDKAMDSLDKIEKYCTNAHYLPFFRGLVLLNSGDVEAATSLFKQAAPLQPDNDSRAMAEFYAGYASTRLGLWSNALDSLRKAVALCPGMREYANLLGVAYYKLKNYEEAEKTFDMALTIDKGSAIDLANRGVCRKFLGKYEDAAEDLRKALELDSGLDFARIHFEELQEKENGK